MSDFSLKIFLFILINIYSINKDASYQLLLFNNSGHTVHKSKNNVRTAPRDRNKFEMKVDLYQGLILNPFLLYTYGIKVNRRIHTGGREILETI